jgi:diacylglycerol kinase family enzyme
VPAEARGGAPAARDDAARPRAVLLLNPAARGAAGARRPEVQAALAARWRLTVRTPEGLTAMRAAIAAAASDGADAVLVAGGDGTLRLAAEALAGRAVPLGILPCGTANDLCRALELPRDPLAAARRLGTSAAPRDVAVVEAGDARFCSVGGLGLVTTAALTVPAWRAGGALARGVARGTGALVYRLAATAALLTDGGAVRRYAISRLTPEGARHDETFLAHGLFVASQRYLGGGCASPPAPRPDGAFVSSSCAPCARAAARRLLAARPGAPRAGRGARGAPGARGARGDRRARRPARRRRRAREREHLSPARLPRRPARARLTRPRQNAYRTRQ